jgi:hypothetical protein
MKKSSSLGPDGVIRVWNGTNAAVLRTFDRPNPTPASRPRPQARSACRNRANARGAMRPLLPPIDESVPRGRLTGMPAAERLAGSSTIPLESSHTRAI